MDIGVLVSSSAETRRERELVRAQEKILSFHAHKKIACGTLSERHEVSYNIGVYI